LTIQSEKVNGVAQGGKFNSVFENNFVNHGIRVRFGSYNIVYGNIVKDGYGITVESSENIIACNTMINCSSGISLFGGKENTVVCNVVNCCGIGLRAMGMANCTFYANYIVNNSVGVWTGPHSFKVYGNNFVNNLKQVVYNSPSTSDLWYKDGQGNYWSNYRGIDLNADGIGDTSFEFAGKGNGTDRYPLMNPLDISSIEVSLPDWASDIPKVTIDTTGFAQNEPQISVMIAAVIVVAVSVCLGVGLFLFRRHRKTSKQQKR
jgi:nitrous oxidase accessory protein NosD